MWLEIPKNIMEIEIPTRFYDAIIRHIASINELYRIKYVVGNKVKVFKGNKI